ncbi:hypothetical protein [Streptomyces sp. CBMA152]|uniref:hypothetical protein n=1 Tax=Streptomyces sp. CBMA152 TaxID=1896312 RepID=UPI0016606501|nr:hypothetical protein [Streptomyces sp. CBMA152]MBD0744946.1 hypothetical protein [Streptomyces sp. CBMA152]
MVELDPNGPAAKAGLERADTLDFIDSKGTYGGGTHLDRGIDQLNSDLAKRPEGAQVRFEVTKNSAREAYPVVTLN